MSRLTEEQIKYLEAKRIVNDYEREQRKHPQLPPIRQKIKR